MLEMARANESQSLDARANHAVHLLRFNPQLLKMPTIGTELDRFDDTTVDHDQQLCRRATYDGRSAIQELQYSMEI